jgi:hypothetical protein
MWRLVKITTLVLCSAALAIGASLRVGYRQPVPANLSMLRLTDCSLPCWIGIEIGQTSRLDARDRILTVFVKEHGFRIRADTYSEALNLVGLTLVSPDDPSQVFDFTLSTVNSLAVQYIWIKPATTVTVGDLLALLGAPGQILPSASSPSLVYNTGGRGLRAYVKQLAILSPREPILYFELYANRQISQSFEVWHGFTALQGRIEP